MSVKERGENIVDLRCPIGPKALLAKVVRQNDHHRMTSTNLLELACRDCRRTEKLRDPQVLQVVHRFNVLGELVESVVSKQEH